jgi:hypothetical protein
LDQFHQGQFAFAVDDDIDQPGRQRLGSDLPKKAAAGYDAPAAGPGYPSQAKSLDATDGLFANSDEGGPPAGNLLLERAPTHLEGRRIQDFDPQAADLLTQHRRQRSEGERRPESAGGAVEGPQGAGWANKEEEVGHCRGGGGMRGGVGIGIRIKIRVAVASAGREGVRKVRGPYR